MSVLITGIAGFIGMHTAAHLLRRGETVIGIDDFNDYYPVALKDARIAELERIGAGRLTVHRVDISDQPALAAALTRTGFDHIVHLAAQAGVRYSLDNPAAYIRANVAGFLHILELAASATCGISSTRPPRRSMAPTRACRSGSRTA